MTDEIKLEKIMGCLNRSSIPLKIEEICSRCKFENTEEIKELIDQHSTDCRRPRTIYTKGKDIFYITTDKTTYYTKRLFGELDSFKMQISLAEIKDLINTAEDTDEIRELVQKVNMAAQKAIFESEKSISKSEENADLSKKLKNQINSIYLQVISLMGVFVAIFSLIVVNANMLSVMAGKTVRKIVEICIAVNGSTLLVIFVLLLFVRRLIIRPLM